VLNVIVIIAIINKDFGELIAGDGLAGLKIVSAFAALPS
jgi:hypothetical protein